MPTPIISYIRVSTDKQSKSGLGIEAQRDAIGRFALRPSRDVCGSGCPHRRGSVGLSLPSSCSGRCEDRPIEIGRAAIDMCYENPLYMAEDAGAADLIAGGRLQLGISRGSFEQIISGWRYFGTCWPKPWS